jgi:hypothetical protein
LARFFHCLQRGPLLRLELLHCLEGERERGGAVVAGV